MSIFDAILGNATETSLDNVYKELAPMLVEGEKLEKVFKIFRDMYVFTDRRLLLIDKQGLTGSKVQFLSIPYKSIIMFAKENAGMLDIDSELILWVIGSSDPIRKEFKRGANIDNVYRIISQYVLK